MLLRPRYVARFRHVAAVLMRHGFADVLLGLELKRFLPGARRARATPEERRHHRAHGLRLALEELGATYVKLGQVLSTRPDILPAAYIEELASLQERVEPFPFARVREAVEAELGRPLEWAFSRFDEVPIASASLAQVHRAELAPGQPGVPGRDVAVKVLRPSIEREVEVDLEVLAEVARLAERSAAGRRHDLGSLVEQLSRTLVDELDLTREARHAAHFRESLAGYPHLYVPAAAPGLATRRMYVTELVRGRRLSELEPGRREPDLAGELWRWYLRQMLSDGIFQCDPHPGNFRLADDGRLALLDHGMVAHLSRETQLQLLTLLLALADRDGEAAADACIDIGVPGREFRERRFRGEIGAMVARYAGLPLRELAVGRVILETVRAAHRNDIAIPPELMLFGKTLLNLEGVCHRLDPDLDPVSAMRETALGLFRSHLGRDLTRHRALAATLELRSLASQVPWSLRRVLRRAARNDLRIGLRLEGEEQLEAAIQKIASRISLGLITAALIVGSALLLNVRAGIMLWGYPLFALIGFVLAFGLGLYLVGKIILVDRY